MNMEITKVSAEYGRTVNMGNYESLRISLGAEAIVQDGQDPAEVQAQLVTDLRNNANVIIQAEFKHLRT